MGRARMSPRRVAVEAVVVAKTPRPRPRPELESRTGPLVALRERRSLRYCLRAEAPTRVRSLAVITRAPGMPQRSGPSNL